MPAKAVSVINGDIKGTVYFEQQVRDNFYYYLNTFGVQGHGTGCHCEIEMIKSLNN